jgi:hypothetical protein
MQDDLSYAISIYNNPLFVTVALLADFVCSLMRP